MNRRAFLGQLAIAVPLAPALLRASTGKSTDIRIDEVSFAYQAYTYRTPLKFGGHLTDRITILNVQTLSLIHI